MSSELAGKPLRWMVATLQAPVPVGWNERDQLCGGRRHDVVDQAGSDPSEAAQAVLLPGGDEGANSRVVLDGGARGGEREPPAGALPATLDRPNDGRPAASAERPREPGQQRGAAAAKGGAREGADDAPPRQEQVQQHMRSR
jgi:hypothetical protein